MQNIGLILLFLFVVAPVLIILFVCAPCLIAKLKALKRTVAALIGSMKDTFCRLLWMLCLERRRKPDPYLCDAVDHDRSCALSCGGSCTSDWERLSASDHDGRDGSD